MTNARDPRKPWTVLAYTVADDKGGHPLDHSAQKELKALCDAADFDQVSIAVQVDFDSPKGVFRGTLTAAPPKSRGFEDIRAEDHPLCDPVAAPARVLGVVVQSRLVRWHHSQTAFHKGTSLFYKPVRREDLEQSFLQAEDENVAAEDAAYYCTLALSKATKWDRIALNPFPISD